jgi:hypothetical protein
MDTGIRDIPQAAVGWLGHPPRTDGGLVRDPETHRHPRLVLVVGDDSAVDRAGVCDGVDSGDGDDIWSVGDSRVKIMNAIAATAMFTVLSAFIFIVAAPDLSRERYHPYAILKYLALLTPFIFGTASLVYFALH